MHNYRCEKLKKKKKTAKKKINKNKKKIDLCYCIFDFFKDFVALFF